MKLAPREHRTRADYLVDNADALQLGRIFLGWGKKRSHAKKARTDAVKDTQTTAKTVSKAEPKKAATPAKTSARPPAKRRLATGAAQRLVAKTTASPPSRRRPSPSKTAAPPAKKAAPAAKAPFPRPPAPALPTPRQPASLVKSHRSKAVSTAKPRARRSAAPPVIPKPVPTPALPAHTPGDAAENAGNSQLVSITVRTMNGSSFRLVLTADTILYELKRQILGVVAPGPTEPNIFQRLPMLVMNGRALMPDNATLRSLRFTPLSTVYCFPEPS
ncbi:hypothetical protein ABB37_00474 [Leptomonas pyrrhocoris]|uniref:Ubiquitin-like domain-containing protein n=1 Tax=Leptomonas pyrrhocoris TaxID=157538 RepID=A0A0N1J5F9_LEPPY|nr:hypothetical protein ABB37_00474 [Leptomonas pyrrhocoris]KPA86241.1 hypothetical protein ABB37_00474 [Leptomonas pyrrhocoris]|eukprot:XP_015664680.1 hypothetical protein ABB37_00474 [Leptomonas pyrrhocoris]